MIDYQGMTQAALQGLIRAVLSGVQRNGLPGDHHFYIAFDPSHPDAAVSGWLRDKYGDEMTVVLQHWFEDLAVNEKGFMVTLNFSDLRESLFIPWASIRTFADPSADFSIRFDVDLSGAADTPQHTGEEDEPEAPDNVVDFASFRAARQAVPGGDDAA